MRTFRVKVPFIGYKIVKVEIENEGEFDSDSDLDEAVWEQAEQEVYNETNFDFDRFEIEKHVEALTTDRYKALIYKFTSEIEDVTPDFEDDELEEENDE